MHRTYLFALLSALLTTLLPGSMALAGTGEAQSLYDLRTRAVTGEEVDLGIYRGQVTLVVNTASRCGFTPQYAGLEELYQRYRGRGFTVLAFPSNDFGSQEPGSNEEIKSFCESKYKTSFPIFEKAPVSGIDKQPVYEFLTERSASPFQGDPGWNFVKFIVNRQGLVVGRFSSMTEPTSERLVRTIEEALG